MSLCVKKVKRKLIKKIKDIQCIERFDINLSVFSTKSAYYMLHKSLIFLLNHLDHKGLHYALYGTCTKSKRIAHSRR